MWPLRQVLIHEQLSRFLNQRVEEVFVTAEDEEPTAEAASLAAAAKDALEPQASTKAHENRQKIASRGGQLIP